MFSSARRTLTTSMCCVPGKGSPPMPTQRDCPRPASVVCATASYVNVPERETMPSRRKVQKTRTELGTKENNVPIRPGLWMCPGWMPILHPRGLMMPGQLGPTRRDLDWLFRAFTTYYCCSSASGYQTIKTNNILGFRPLEECPP